jgi:hypothetical protein
MRLKAFVGMSLFVMGVGASAAHARTTECTMRYNLRGWSAFYKTASGAGTIRCDNGQKAEVRISSRGGGLTAGKTEIRDGTGYFSRVSSISELFGRYGAASADAAAGKAASAARLRKGSVNLSLTGTGKGVELGVSLSRLTITKR